MDFAIGLIATPRNEEWGLRVAQFGEREDFLIEGRAHLAAPDEISEIELVCGYDRRLGTQYDAREGPFIEHLKSLIAHTHADEMAREWLLEGDYALGDMRAVETVGG